MCRLTGIDPASGRIMLPRGLRPLATELSFRAGLVVTLLFAFRGHLQFTLDLGILPHSASGNRWFAF